MIFQKQRTDLRAILLRNFSQADHQFWAISLISLIGFPFFYWLWTNEYPQPYENLGLRLAACLLGLGLLLKHYWPACLTPTLPAYWFLTLTYILSFFPAYYFLMSNASVVSAMSLMCSVFLLILLVDLSGLILSMLSGWLLALGVYYLSAPLPYVGEEHIEMLVMIIFILIAASAVNYKTAMLQQQRLAGIAAAAGMIAHELRTPLAGIKGGAQALDHYLPQLIQSYKIARDQGLLSAHFRESRLQQIGQVNSRIISEINYANTIIDMLLIKAGHENALQNCILEDCSIAECIANALERYPFKSPSERELVSWQGDFKFQGSKLLMQHVLFNLLKNALYAIATAQKGDIKIWTAVSENYHCLYFRDSAKGMTEQQLKQLFNHFYTTTFMGTGLGLSFCKLVMQRFGGNILCEAQEGRFTQFMLTFPKSPFLDPK